MQEYIFRKANIRDFKEISALYREAVGKLIENQIFQWDEIYPNDEVLFEDILKNEMYLCEADGKITACVVINEEQAKEYRNGSWKYTEGNIAVIHRLCVHPDAQGMGVGKKMMNYTENTVMENGYDIIRLDAFPQNNNSLKLYESLGYSNAGEVTFRKGQFYLLEKKLRKRLH